MKKVVLTTALCLAATAASGAENLAEMFGEGQLKGVFRTFYFEQDFDGATTDKEDLAIGGWLHYETGSLWGIKAGVELRTAQDLGTSTGTNTMGLLVQDGDGREGYTALSQYYLSGEWFNTTVKFGAQEVNTPWLKSHDIRFMPKRYRGLGIVNKSIPKVELRGYYLTDVMQWNSDEFVSFSDFKTGADVEDGAAAIGGIIWRAPGPLKIQVWDYYLEDMWHSPYINATWRPKLSDDIQLIVDGRFLKQDSVGDELDGECDTYYAGGSVALAGYGAKLTAQYATVGDDTIKHKWGTHFVVLGQSERVQYGDEQGYGLKLDYDFGRLGLKGLSAYTYYMIMDRPDSGVNAGDDRNELDFQIQYKFPQPALKGLSLKLRHAIVDKDTGTDYTDTRAYLQYAFNFPLNSK